MKLDPKVVTLYRYFAYAAHMRDLFRREVNAEQLKMLGQDERALALFLFCSPAGIYLLYSYSGIYLVIEGWRDLKLKDPRIDKLLTSAFVDRLRRFRNATFHYQKDLFSRKHVQFFGTEEEQTEQWLNDLYSALEKFFREHTLPLPSELKVSMKDKSSVEMVQAIRDFWAFEAHSKNAERPP